MPEREAGTTPEPTERDERTIADRLLDELSPLLAQRRERIAQGLPPEPDEDLRIAELQQRLLAEAPTAKRQVERTLAEAQEGTEGIRGDRDRIFINRYHETIDLIVKLKHYIEQRYPEHRALFPAIDEKFRQGQVEANKGEMKQRPLFERFWLIAQEYKNNLLALIPEEERKNFENIL